MRRLAWLLFMCLAPAQDPRFGVQSRLVVVPVTVADAKGRLLDGLEPEDFQVFDNGQSRKTAVDFLATGVAPIALVVAIQASGISKPVLEKVRKIGGMIQPLVTGERGCAAILSFSDRLDWLQRCTNDDVSIARAFEAITPGPPKAGRMLDAATEAVAELRKRPNSRKVLLLISETRDRGSESTLQQAADAVQKEGVIVYAATYSAFGAAWTTKSSAIADPQMPKAPTKPSDETGTATGGPEQCNPFGCPSPKIPGAAQSVDIMGALVELVRREKVDSTQALTQATGGVTFPFLRQKGLEDAIEKLGAHLHSQYLLTFMPDAGASGYHRIEVRVNRPNVQVRSRAVYWAGE
ncbi:MAG: VWA domain-containing protein [Acidobacteria bacterium]|nr:VWA domain-containing protein [Acidobacteriota bacterium]